MNRILMSGWIVVVLSLVANAEIVTNSLNMQSNLVINLGYVNAGDQGQSFTNPAILWFRGRYTFESIGDDDP